ncbi:ribosome biogenesis GTPase [Weissella uvarum]|uniref:ribosome small subunit-dependent GTPase A n=1 Tax=Weissella uvarum TaxID=1479233 RepID=UPI0019615FFE|nr:ribosome small subunit-dependent GTPase A [Weissella uvarum]MBM7616587.1 ribosome biogenesis GTPase [Weissella uvarum]MCM0594954.1 ribosome small subunit-dependent GTPase A [Weissella uvarum]
MTHYNLKTLGYTTETAATLESNQIIGRISSQSKDIYKVLTDHGEGFAKISGKYFYEINSAEEYPAVGDFVTLNHYPDSDDFAIIQDVLPRKSTLTRQSAGNSTETQLIATNIDSIFICMSLNEDYNLRRLERYLAIAWDSGAMPYIVLTKSDLCSDIQARLAEISDIALGVDVILTTNAQKDGYATIQKHLHVGKTAAFIGSSGVGKSTIINHFIGDAHIETDGLRNDDKGHHTTTRRDLYVLPNDLGIVIDTPGMRELGVGNTDITKSYEDIEALAVQCKFNDCTHTTEPKCAVKAAIQTGELSKERFENYQKLQLEAQYGDMDARMIEQTKLNRMIGGKKALKQLRRQNQH